jgi:hypothetical protein
VLQWEEHALYLALASRPGGRYNLTPTASADPCRLQDLQSFNDIPPSNGP